MTFRFPLSLLQILFVLFVFCAYPGMPLHSQDSATVQIRPDFKHPGDLDAAKVDLFFSSNSIDFNQCGNPELYFEVFRWYKTCYCYGGNSKKGIDCSHFVNTLYEKIYGKTLGPSVSAIMHQCKLLKKGLKKAREGDLVFFKINKGKVSHVGIYLQNGKFAHATVHNGVIISDINEPYYKKRFYKAGRV